MTINENMTYEEIKAEIEEAHKKIEDIDTLENIYRNIDIPFEIIIALYSDEKYSFPIALFVACNLNTPPAILGEMICDVNTDLHIRNCILMNSNIPSEIIELFEEFDHDIGIRWILSQNPNTPKRMLQKYLNDEDQDIAENAQINLDNNHTPYKELLYMIHEKYSEAESLIDLQMEFMNMEIDLEILEQLYEEDTDAARFFLASCNSTPSEILEKIINDPEVEFFIKTFALDNINTGSSILAQFGEYDDLDIKTVLSQHPNTPRSILEKYLDDEDQGIAESARNNLNQGE